MPGKVPASFPLPTWRLPCSLKIRFTATNSAFFFVPFVFFVVYLSLLNVLLKIPVENCAQLMMIGTALTYLP